MFLAWAQNCNSAVPLQELGRLHQLIDATGTRASRDDPACRVQHIARLLGPHLSTFAFGNPSVQDHDTQAALLGTFLRAHTLPADLKGSLTSGSDALSELMDAIRFSTGTDAERDSVTSRRLSHLSR